MVKIFDNRHFMRSHGKLAGGQLTMEHIMNFLFNCVQLILEGVTHFMASSHQCIWAR
jgi:N-acetylglucosamine-6-phosphate deacetylase